MQIINIFWVTLTLIPFLLYWLVRKEVIKLDYSNRAKRGWITKRKLYMYKSDTRKRKNRSSKARQYVFTDSKPIQVNNHLAGTMNFIRRD